MYKDVQNSNNVDKQMLNQLVNENVIRFQPKTKFKKGSFYCPFFLSALKIFNELLRRLEVVFYFFFEAKHKYIANNAPTIGMNGRIRSCLFILRFFNLLEMLASNEINSIILKPK